MTNESFFTSVSAVVFAKEFRRVAAFYREVLNARVISAGADHETLDCRGFHLVVFQIPDAMARSIMVSTPPERRERTAVRLNFTVDDIGAARQAARRHGGDIDERSPPWASDDSPIYLGFDPEGNVIGLHPARGSAERATAPSADALFTREHADQVVARFLDDHEVATFDFESPLPLHEDPHTQKLVVVRVDEHDFGWVYFYDSSLHAQTGKACDVLVGNAPLIVDRTDGKLYVTGTAFPIEHYLEDHRRGKRTPA